MKTTRQQDLGAKARPGEIDVTRKSFVGRWAWWLPVAVLYVLFVALTWDHTEARVTGDARKEIAAKAEEASVQSAALAATVTTNLRHLHGVATIIASDRGVQDLAQRFDRTGKSQSLMNARLAEFGRGLGVGVIWILNADGLCVSASNAGAPESFVGVNYQDRAYYVDAKGGRLGFQYALGRKSNWPGLFFSAPIVVGPEKRFVGAVILKIDLPTVPWVQQIDAYVYDQNGVVILAHTKAQEGMATANATVMSLPEKTRVGIYKKANFEALDVRPSEQWSQLGVMRRGGEGGEVFVSSNVAMPEYRLGVVVQRRLEIPSNFKRLSQETFRLYVAIGTLLFAIVVAAAAYIVTRHKMAKALANLAFYDALTGLVNRRLLQDRLIHAAGVAARGGTHGAVINIDLDNFKCVNDQCGHAGGDRLLVAVAHRLKGCVRSVDTVARIGGDEFVVLLEGLSGDEGFANEHARSTAEKIRAALNVPHRLVDSRRQPREYTCSPSMGICVFGIGAELDVVCKRADEAMYQAKASGKNSVVVAVVSAGVPESTSIAGRQEGAEVRARPVMGQADAG